MSESKEHRELVMRLARDLATRYPTVSLTTDIQEKPGDSTPGLISGYRPDIYASVKSQGLCIICEAKTTNDLDNSHTNLQLRSFSAYLETHSRGLLVLGISGEGADRAKTILRFMAKELSPKVTTLQLFDGLDYWELRQTWHLL